MLRRVKNSKKQPKVTRLLTELDEASANFRPDSPVVGFTPQFRNTTYKECAQELTSSEKFQTIKSQSPKTRTKTLAQNLGPDAHLTDKSYYYKETEMAKAIAVSFFLAFFSDHKRDEVLDGLQATRAKKKIEKHGHGDEDEAKIEKIKMKNAKCISFVGAELNGHHACFIGLSHNAGEDDSALRKCIEETCDELNKKQNKDIPVEFFLAPKGNEDFHQLIPAVAQKLGICQDAKHNVTRNCAEKSFLPMMLKSRIMTEKIVFTGIVNLPFYRIHSKDTASLSVMTLPLPIQNLHLKFTTKCNCQDCQINQPPMMTALACAPTLASTKSGKQLSPLPPRVISFIDNALQNPKESKVDTAGILQKLKQNNVQSQMELPQSAQKILSQEKQDKLEREKQAKARRAEKLAEKQKKLDQLKQQFEQNQQLLSDNNKPEAIIPPTTQSEKTTLVVKI